MVELAPPLWVLFIYRCYKYAKEGFYGRVNDFEQITNISTESFGE